MNKTGVFPVTFQKDLDEFDQMIIWKRMSGSQNEVPEPMPGYDHKFDSAN